MEVSPMNHVSFTQEELDEIVWACALVEIDDCTPPYLQDFIATRLADDHPELSTKVRCLTPTEMDALCEHIKSNPSAV
jgi:hypothetical protein